MNQDHRSGGEPEREETLVDLEPICKTYNAAIRVVAMGRRWLKTRPVGGLNLGIAPHAIFYTYMDVFGNELVGYVNRYGHSAELCDFIRRTRPLSDAFRIADSNGIKLSRKHLS